MVRSIGNGALAGRDAWDQVARLCEELGRGESAAETWMAGHYQKL